VGPGFGVVWEGFWGGLEVGALEAESVGSGFEEVWGRFGNFVGWFRSGWPGSRTERSRVWGGCLGLWGGPVGVSWFLKRGSERRWE
jgi:hypothetical protein